MIPIVLTIAAATAIGFATEHRLGEPRAVALAGRAVAAMLWVGLPVVAFFNIADLHPTAGVGAGLAFGYLAIAAVMVCAYLLGRRVLRLSRPSLGSLMVASSFGNTGYLGLPLTAALFGFDVVGEAVVYDVVVSGIGLLTIGFAVGAAFGTVAEAPRERVSAFFTRNPPLWAALAGALAPAALAPEWAVDGSRLLIFAMLPLGFFVVGVTLSAEAEEGAIRFPPPLTAAVGTAVALKLALMPAVVAALSLLLIDVPDSYISQAAMACGINTLIVAHAYGLDRALAAGAVMWSTAIVVVVGAVASLF